MAATFVSEHERYSNSSDCLYRDKNGDVARSDHCGGFTENVPACSSVIGDAVRVAVAPAALALALAAAAAGQPT